MENAPQLPEASEKLLSIKEKLENLRSRVPEKQQEELERRIAGFAQYLRGKYGGANEFASYGAYQALDDTFGVPSVPKFDHLNDDFEGEDSVAAYLDRLEAEYLPKQE